MRVFGAAVGLLILVLGCGRPVEAELLELRGASPDRVAPGHRLRIEGRGLPIGREARVRLDGVLHRPARPPRAIDAEITGTVVSAERLEIPMPEATLRRLGGRGTFRGRIEVSFGAGIVDGRVLGSVEDVVLDLVPAREPAIGGDVPFSERIGLTLEAPEDAELAGILVTSVAEGSRAAAAGVVAGDRILELDGLRLFAPDELEPSPESARVDLTLARAGLADAAVATIDVSRIDETIPRERVRVGQLAALVLLLAICFLGPASLAIDRLSPVRAGGPPVVLAAFAMVAAVATRIALELVPAVGLEAPLFAAIAGRGAVMVVTASGGRARIVAITRAVVGALAAAAFLGATTIAIGTTAASAVEAAQGVWPWEWIALRSPIGPFAMLLAIVIAACGPCGSDRGPEGRDRARTIDDAFLVVIAIPITIAALGGALAVDRIDDVRPALALLGYLPYAIVTALVAILLQRARDRARTASTWVIALGSTAIAAAAMLVAVGWLELEVPREIEQAIGEVIAVVAIVITLRIATARPPAPVRPIHAML